MSLTNIVPAIVLETILSRLAVLFLTGAAGDTAAARHAAVQMLETYHPHTEEELFLAANIIAFSFQALEALSQAASPDLSLTRILRLRSGAVSLNREADKARRALTQLQKTRQQTQPADQPAEATQPPAQTATQAPRPQPRPQTEEERLRDLRIEAGLKRLAAREAAAAAAAAAAAMPPAMIQANQSGPMAAAI
jgi:hypothetical protein